MKSTKQKRHTQQLLPLAGILALFVTTTVYPSDPGDLDASFSDGGLCGLVITDFSADWDQVFAIAIQSDGKFVVAGRTGTSCCTDFLVMRYESNGGLDTTFGVGGAVTIDIDEQDIIRDVLIQPDGKIVASGESSKPLLGTEKSTVVRLNSDGSLDPTFALGGVFVDPVGPSSTIGTSIQPDGKIVLSGGPTVLRLLPDGTLDPAFGTGGRMNAGMGTRDVAIQTDGKLVFVGTLNSGSFNFDFAVARFLADGTFDTTFGVGGMVTTDIIGQEDIARAVALQSDGKIVVVGTTLSKGALARYNTDGTLDMSFGIGGQIVTHFSGTNFSSDAIYDVAIQSDGKIVVAGVNNGNPTLARYDTAGNLDTADDPTFPCFNLPDDALTFGDGGIVRNEFVAGAARGIAIQSDGKIVVAGGSLTKVFLARHHFVASADPVCNPPPVGPPTILGTIVPPGTGAGTVVYENTETAFNRDMGIFDPGVGDDLHLLRAGTLSSFEFTFSENGLQDIFAVVRFFANDQDDLGILPNTINEFDPATEIATIRTCVSGLSATEGNLHILSIEPTEPIDLPQDVWITIDLIFDFADPAAGLTRIPISSDVEVGTSHEFLLIGGSDQPANASNIYQFNDFGSLNLDIVLRMVPDVSDTPTGMGVVVEPEAGVTLTFSNVQQAGITTVTTSGTNPQPDSNFEFLGVFYEIETNATFTGQIEVCFDYDDTGLSIDQENSLQLLHFDGTSWVDTTDFVDTTSNVICGSTNSFSLFAVGHTVPHPAQELIGQLIDDVSALNVKQGISNSLDAKLDRARNALDDFNDNNNAAAINAISAFLEEVQAQRGNQISEEDADVLIDLAIDILLLL